MTQEVLTEEPLNRRQAAKNQTRQKAITAARGLFVEKGYKATTIRDIARAMEMSTGAVFANFDGKHQLLLVIVNEELAGYTAHLRALDLEGLTPTDRAAEVLLADHDFFETRYRLLEEIRYLEGQSDANAKHFQACRQKLVEGYLVPAFTKHAVRVLWSAYDAMGRRASRDSYTRAEVRQEIDEILLCFTE